MNLKIYKFTCLISGHEKLKGYQKDFATKYSEGSVHSLVKRALENIKPVRFYCLYLRVYINGKQW